MVNRHLLAYGLVILMLLITSSESGQHRFYYFMQIPFVSIANIPKEPVTTFKKSVYIITSVIIPLSAFVMLITIKMFGK